MGISLKAVHRAVSTPANLGMWAPVRMGRSKPVVSFLSPASPASDDVLAVLAAAFRIDHDARDVREWFVQTQIWPLDQLTAAELVAAGRAREVLAFLTMILTEGTS
jgi:hypothetical protein